MLNLLVVLRARVEADFPLALQMLHFGHLKLMAYLHRSSYQYSQSEQGLLTSTCEPIVISRISRV